MDSTIKPSFYRQDTADGIIAVSTEEAYVMTKKLAKEEGLFVGISSGANVAAATKLAKTISSNVVVVTILCDGGIRYISDPFWGAN